MPKHKTPEVGDLRVREALEPMSPVVVVWRQTLAPAVPAKVATLVAVSGRETAGLPPGERRQQPHSGQRMSWCASGRVATNQAFAVATSFWAATGRNSMFHVAAMRFVFGP